MLIADEIGMDKHRHWYVVFAKDWQSTRIESLVPVSKRNRDGSLRQRFSISEVSVHLVDAYKLCPVRSQPINLGFEL